MNWSKVNGVLVGAFLVINICLGLILYNNRTKYEVSGTRLTELQINLDRYHIAMYDFIPSYEPMQRLGIVRSDLDTEQIAKNVFEHTEYVMTKENSGVVEYNDGEKKLIFYNNEVFPEEFTYEEHWDGFIINTSEVSIQEYADNIVSKFNIKKTGLKNVVLKKVNNGDYEIIYIGHYEKTPIFGSYIKILIKSNGNVIVTIKLMEVKNFIKEKHYLVEPEEMLYNLGERIGKDKGEQTIIKEIDIGYDAGDRLFQEVKQDYIEPYYRIELLDGQVFYINAYTNEIVN